jgi:hypothetical protein
VYSIPDENERQRQQQQQFNIFSNKNVNLHDKTYEVAVWGTEESKHAGPVNCVLVQFIVISVYFIRY